MNRTLPILATSLILSACGQHPAPDSQQEPSAEESVNPSASVEATSKSWQTVFFDDFDSFDDNNWRDQILWVNNEDQCYVRDGAHKTAK